MKHHSWTTSPQRSPVCNGHYTVIYISLLILIGLIKYNVSSMCKSLSHVMFHFLNVRRLRSTTQLCLVRHASVWLAVWSSFVWKLIYLQVMLCISLPVRYIRYIFCLSEHYTGRVCLVYLKGNEETLKCQNSLLLSYLLHVNLYTMSCARVCVCVREREYLSGLFLIMIILYLRNTVNNRAEQQFSFFLFLVHHEFHSWVTWSDRSVWGEGSVYVWGGIFIFI